MGSRVKRRYFLILIPLFIVILGILILRPGKKLQINNKGDMPPSHHSFTVLLNKYVDQNGMVDYRGFQSDSSSLVKYLELLSENVPDDKKWSENEKLAYWINAYNAFTIKLVIDHYPISGIKDLGGSIQIPFVNSPWDISFISIGESVITLNDIEHRILRKEFEEPRIHFAIVCASISCPDLRSEAYSSENLDEQLNEQATRFINDPEKNLITKNKIALSRIFQWFSGDFKKDGTLIEFLNQYSSVEISPDAAKEFLKYNWGLNDQIRNSSGGGS